jgi:uncharacterized protein
MNRASETQIELTILPDLGAISESEWDACAAPETADGARPNDPFTTHRFLRALETSGSVGTGSGWQPRHLVARANGETIAVAPMYAKSHSQGEYIFDHNWAHAWERAGGRYYPKLQMAVPFTPATGRRFLVKQGFEASGQAALVQGAVQVASEMNVSSLHITFCTDEELVAGKAMGLMPRASQQFHWENDGYKDFDAFLVALSSRKRKNIRKERAQAQGFGGEILSLTGDQIKPEHWNTFWQFYQDTGARKWGTPYLTRRFFDEAHAKLRNDILMVLAVCNGRPIAGALNFIGREKLYGRYWGCIEDHACLHFELCYYQAIDFAITNNLKTVEAGAQGAHKLARGYLPVRTNSLHWVADAGFADAIARYLDEEAQAVDHENGVLAEYGPFKQMTVEEQE